MAITVDVQPAYASTSTLTVTTASFTPTSGSLLVALVGIGNGSGTAGSGSSVITDTGSHSWTLLKRENPSASSTTAEVWVANNTATSAITVTATSQITGQADIGLQVVSFLGTANVAGQTGASAVATASSVSVVTTETGSQIVGAFGYFTSVTLTANANSTIYGKFNGTAGDTAAAFKATSLTGTPGATSVGFTNTTNANMSIAAVEILPSSGSTIISAITLPGSIMGRATQFAPGLNGGLIEQIQPNFWQQNRPAPVVAPNLTTQSLQIMVPAYVGAGDPELTDIANASPAVGGVIFDVNNGDSAIGSSLLAQVDSIRALGIKVFWYIYAPYTPSFRSLTAIQTALNNGLVTGDGIIHFDGVFIDEYARDAGSSPGLLDYITYYTTLRSLIRDTANGVVPQSGGTVLAMANPGTAIDDRYVSQNVADIFNTFEGTLQSYNNSWLGGNVFNLGSGLYRLGQDFPAAKFCHLVTNVSPTTDPSTMRSTIDTAYERWTGWTYVTDQPISPNPWINSPAWGFSAETSYAAGEPYFNSSFPGMWPGTYGPGWPGPELDLISPNFWMSGSTTTSTNISVSDVDSSLGSETQSLALTDSDSSLGSDNQLISLTSVDSFLESDVQIVGIASTDSSVGTDFSGTIPVSVSSVDNSIQSDIQIVSVADFDSTIGTDSSQFVALSSTDSGKETENFTVSLSSSDNCQETDVQSFVIFDYDYCQEGEFSSPPVVNVSVADNILLGDYQLGSRMAYKIFVSNFSSDVGIPSIIELITGLPQLTIDPLSTTAIVSNDSGITNESSNIVTALSTSDSSAANDISLPIAIAINVVDSSIMVENSSLLITTTVSSSDSCTTTETISNFSTNIHDSEISSASEASTINVFSTDVSMGTDFGLVELFQNDADHSVLADFQATTVALNSTDSSLGLEIQNVTILFSSSDLVSFKETESFIVSQKDSDKCSLVSEDSLFFWQTSLTMQWGIFPHLNQVVFAQPLS